MNFWDLLQLNKIGDTNENESGDEDVENHKEEKKRSWRWWRFVCKGYQSWKNCDNSANDNQNRPRLSQFINSLANLNQEVPPRDLHITPKGLLNNTLSKNRFINDNAKWVYTDERPCVKCEEVTTSQRFLRAIQLSAWEKSYLKHLLIFGASGGLRNSRVWSLRSCDTSRRRR